LNELIKAIPSCVLTMLLPANPQPLGPLPVEASYPDYDTLEAAIEQLAEANGYAISRDGKTATKVT
jgi:hypothetical protein